MLICPICDQSYTVLHPFCNHCGWDIKNSFFLNPHKGNTSPNKLEGYEALVNCVKTIWTERLSLIENNKDLENELKKLRKELTEVLKKKESKKRIIDAYSDGELEIEMVFIPGGKIMMGSSEKEDETPVHEVVLDDFYMGKYLVTQAQWCSVMGHNPGKFQGDDKLPVEWVSWYNVQEYIRRLNQMTKKRYRLPTEAEWEYACRAGSDTRFYFGDDENSLGKYAWYELNSDFESHPVGQKKPNEWGLYDMLGNVFEWCQDVYKKDFYQKSPRHNPVCEDTGSRKRVLRGGGWSDRASYCRSTDRLGRSPETRSYHIGIRLAK